MTGETILESTLRELVDTGSDVSLSAQGMPGGFALSIRCGSSERHLASTRGEIRLFPNLTSLAILLRRLGVSRFEVETANYVPGRVRRARPDRAEALRRTRTRPRQAQFFGGES
jgi:hypothetical protein